MPDLTTFILVLLMKKAPSASATMQDLSGGTAGVGLLTKYLIKSYVKEKAR